LMESIKEHGILQPLVVTEKKADPSTKLRTSLYELIAGERRLKASLNLHLKTVPVIVRTAGELEKLELSLIENIQRQDLNPIERADAYKKLVDEFSLTHEQAAKRMGKSRPVISNTLRLLDLPAQVQKMIGDGRLNESAALAVLEIDDPAKQLELAQAIATEKLTKDEARRRVRQSVGRSSSVKPQKGDPLLKGFEEALQSKLQTTVKIGRRGKSGYKVEIDTFSKEELENLVNKILNSSNSPKV
jgi:ParB family transcriptional regulator, chromosome partitioning protein